MKTKTFRHVTNIPNKGICLAESNLKLNPNYLYENIKYKSFFRCLDYVKIWSINKQVILNVTAQQKVHLPFEYLMILWTFLSISYKHPSLPPSLPPSCTINYLWMKVKKSLSIHLSKKSTGDRFICETSCAIN